MSSNRLAFAPLGLACIAAAPGGGYLATRQNTVPTPAAAMTPAATAAPVATTTPAPPPTVATPERPVQETEAVVVDTAKVDAKKIIAVPKPIVASKRTESAANAPRTASGSGPANARRDQPPPLASTWPSSAASQPPAPPLPPP